MRSRTYDLDSCGFPACGEAFFIAASLSNYILDLPAAVYVEEAYLLEVPLIDSQSPAHHT